MTTFRNHSTAGDSTPASGGGRVPAAAVWEPSGFREGTAAERQVRTLRPCPRTQDRVITDAPEGWGSGYPQQETGPRETGLAYLLGVLLGLAVVSASLVGAGEEAPVPTHPTGTERAVLPQNG